MIQELIYTSAPQGLKPGSGGYCTVAMTDGMAPTLIDQLESLSGYRHVFPPQDPQARLNPVNFSCLKISVGGVRYTVLSRIADAGLDYTQRTNKLAHHVALDAAECSANSCGPAAALLADGFVATAWQGQPRFLQRGVGKPFPSPTGPAVCKRWHELTGDAGWAGALVEAALRKQDAVVLFTPGTDVLPLVVEALALLDPAQRWEITFSTYFTKLPPGIECRWRFVVAGSNEAKSAARLPNTLVVELRPNFGQATGGDYVQAARTGNVVRSVPAAPQNTSATTDTVVNLVQQQRSMITPVEAPPITGYGLAPPTHRGESSAAQYLQGPAPSGNRLPAYRPPQSTNRMYYFVGAGIAAAFLLGVGGMYLLMSNNRQKDEALAQAERQVAELRQERQEQQQRIPEKAPQPEPQPSKIEPEPAPSPPPMPVASAPPPEPAPPPKIQEPEKKSDPQVAFAGLDAIGNYLEIPSYKSKIPGERPEAKSLVQINVLEPEDCELELVGAEDAFPTEYSVTLTTTEKQPEGQRLWNLLYQPLSFGKPSGQPKRAAELLLDGNDFRFQWDQDVPVAMSKESLLQCLLKFTVNGKSRLCKLSKTKAAVPIRFAAKKDSPAQIVGFQEDEHEIKVPVLGLNPPNTAERITNPKLKVEFRFQRDDGQAVTGTPGADGKSAQLNISEVPGVPCQLEFALTSIKQAAGVTLGVSIALSGKIYELKQNKYELVEKKQLTPRMLMAATAGLDEVKRTSENQIKNLRETSKILNGKSLKTIDEEMKRLNAALMAKENQKKNAERDKNPATVTFVEGQIAELNAQISAKKQEIDDATKKLIENKNFVDATNNLKHIEGLIAQHAKLMDLRDKLTVHYTVYLDYPEQQIVLYDTELAAPPATAGNP